MPSALDPYVPDDTLSSALAGLVYGQRNAPSATGANPLRPFDPYGNDPGNAFGDQNAGLGSVLARMARNALSIPQRAFEASNRFYDTGDYDPGPILNAAMLPMGTGAIAGVPLRGSEIVLGAGAPRNPFLNVNRAAENAGNQLRRMEPPELPAQTAASPAAATAPNVSQLAGTIKLAMAQAGITQPQAMNTYRALTDVRSWDEARKTLKSIAVGDDPLERQAASYALNAIDKYVVNNLKAAGTMR